MAKKQKVLQWDFTTEDCLRLAASKELFFDPEMSYEITGYRPITETQGLDFDPTPFQEVGADNMRTGKYSGLREGSRGHYLWWEEQRKRCNVGYQVGDYRITGDYYFFLNFYTMDEKSFAGNKKIHPKFWAAHYAFFHYVELCEKVGMDGLLLKARGIETCPLSR